MNRRLASYAALALIAAATSMNPVHAQITTAFTYQAQLNDAGAPYSGSADVQFRLFAGPADPTQIGPTLTSTNLTCVDGRFTTTLNFLNMVPAGGHIEISVRTPHDPTNTAPFITLTPRQPVTAAPLAYRSEESAFADSANLAANALTFGGQAPAFYQNAANLSTGTLPSARLSGTYSSPVGFTNPGNAISGSGAGLTALNATNITTGTLSPARGGTGSSISSATLGHVLKWNGSAFTAQPESTTTYSAGAGLALAGSVFSISGSGVTNAMLASDAASLQKISGGAMQTNGSNVTFAGTIEIPTTMRSMVLPPAAFQRSGQGVTTLINSSLVGTVDGGLIDVVAPVILPAGARIVGFTVFGQDNDATNNMVVRLNNVDLTTGTLTQEATTTTASLSGRFSLSVNGLNIVTAPTKGYTVQASWQGINDPFVVSLTGVRIDYTITSPLP